jgi:hypothetical protein
MRGVLLEKSRGENLLGKPRRRLEDIIKEALEHKTRVFELGSSGAEQGATVRTTMNLRVSYKAGNSSTIRANIAKEEFASWD